MRSSYSRELKAQALLQKDGIPSFVPTQTKRKIIQGEVVDRQEALVHNLIFVRSTRNQLDPWKRLHEGDAALRYIIDKSTSLPMVVPEKAVNDFIRVTSEANASLIYLDNPDIVLTKGQKVEVVVGPFRGIQGYILRIRRDRRIVVTLNGLVSVALATMPKEYFRLITSPQM